MAHFYRRGGSPTSGTLALSNRNIQAENAAILAAQIIALWHDEIWDKIKDHKSQLAKKVEEKDRALKEKIAEEVLRK